MRKLYAVGWLTEKNGLPVVEEVYDNMEDVADYLDGDDSDHTFVAELNIIGTAQRQVVKTGVLAEIVPQGENTAES